MKRGTPDHWKMKDLARRCRVPSAYALPWANGIMERIWHYAEKYCLQGDIGKFPNEEIAEICCWPVKRADALINALLEAKWLDFSEKHRLLIHDWQDHCTDSVKKTLNNRGLEIFIPESSGKIPANSGTILPALALPNLTTTTTAEPPQKPAAGPVLISPPRPKRRREKPRTPQVQSWLDGQFWPIYPRKVSKGEARDAAEEMASDPQEQEKIIAGLKVQLAEFARLEARYIPHPATYLRKRRWEDEYSPQDDSNSGTKPFNFGIIDGSKPMFT